MTNEEAAEVRANAVRAFEAEARFFSLNPSASAYQMLTRAALALQGADWALTHARVARYGREVQS